MREVIDSFTGWKAWMKICGSDSPFNNILGHMWRWLMIYGNFHYFIVITIFLFGDTSFSTKLEAFLFLLGGFPCAYKHLIFSFRRKTLFLLVDELNGLTTDIGKVYGTGKVMRWRQLCNYLTYCYSCQFLMLCLPVTAFTYYNYYCYGIVTPPYQMYIPFDTHNRIHLVVFYVIFSLAAPAWGLIMASAFYGSLTIVLCGVMGVLQKRYAELNSYNFNESMKLTTKWHGQLIKIMDSINDLMGSLFVVEYLLAMAYVSFSGFIFIKAGSSNGGNASKNVAVALICICMPLLFGVCGHILQLQNDKLCNALFNNDWYLLTPKQRENFILPSMAAQKGLGFTYKQCVQFDMNAYFKILRQSYSFLTVLRLME